MSEDVLLATCTILIIILCGLVNLAYLYFRTHHGYDDDFEALSDIV
jgi:hypothetical protein